MEIGSFSSQGGREYNEDSIEIWKKENRCCVIVADGLGGHGGGKEASLAASKALCQGYVMEEDICREKIQKLFFQANEAVLSCQNLSCQMKTTCVGLFIQNDQAIWGHIGDSRLYHFVDGQLSFCTLDHSVSQMAVLSGEITKDQIRFHEDRNKVIRVLGMKEGIKPDLSEASLNDGSFHAFLLCTDGFWEYVLEGEMEIDLSKAADPSEWIAFMTERLRKRAGCKNDNYSAAAVFVHAE